MLRSALALLSSLQIGLRIRESIERSLRQAVVIAVAVGVLIAAGAFGLVVAYEALVLSYGFTPLVAAFLVAAAPARSARVADPCHATPVWAEAQSAATKPGGSRERGLGPHRSERGPSDATVRSLLAVAIIAGVLLSRRN